MKGERLAKVVRRQQGRCWLCGQAFTEDNPPTKDHVQAKAVGGSGDWANIKAAHARCNRRRGHDDGAGWHAAHPGRLLGSSRPARPIVDDRSAGAG